MNQQQLQASPKKQPAPPTNRQQEQYERLAERARLQQQVEQKHNIQPVAAPHMQQAPPQQMAPMHLPPSTRASLGGQPAAMIEQQQIQQQAQKERRKKEQQSTRRAAGDENPYEQQQQAYHQASNNQGGHPSSIPMSANQSLNNSIITGAEKPQVGVLSRQATQAIPQVQFQVNVSTVQYKLKKQSTNVSNNYGYGLGGGGIESPRGFTNYGAPTMPIPNIIGIENSNDRGDEINLDELHKYIGGGGGARKF